MTYLADSDFVVIKVTQGVLFPGVLRSHWWHCPCVRLNTFQPQWELVLVALETLCQK